jgi:hypothetical protein
MANDPIREIEKRTQRYWFEDGIWDLGFGFILLIMGLFFLFTANLPEENPISKWAGLFQIVLIVGSFFALSKVVRLLKERITYPRTGFVVYRRKNRSRRALTSGLVGMVFAGSMAYLTTLPIVKDRITAVNGILLGLTCLYLGYRFGVIRYYLIGGLTILIGYLISLQSVEYVSGVGWFFSSFGVIWLVSGAAALIHYLRSTQPADKDSDSTQSGENL